MIRVLGSISEKASQQHAGVIANLAPYQSLPLAFFSYADILLLYETEATQLATDYSIDTSSNLAENIASQLETTVVLTRGVQWRLKRGRNLQLQANRLFR